MNNAKHLTYFLSLLAILGLFGTFIVWFLTTAEEARIAVIPPYDFPKVILPDSYLMLEATKAPLFWVSRTPEIIDEKVSTPSQIEAPADIKIYGVVDNFLLVKFGGYEKIMRMSLGASVLGYTLEEVSLSHAVFKYQGRPVIVEIKKIESEKINIGFSK